MSYRSQKNLFSIAILMIALLLGGGLVGCTSGGTDSSADGDKVVPDNPREGTVQSIQQADDDLQAETTVHDYRVGATILESQNIYDGSDVVSSTENGNRQLRLILRDQRTKRYLPGADVEVTFGGTDESRTLKLLETWGPYHFYGTNVNVPEEATTLLASVEPPRVGRHADMKERHRQAFQVEFPLERDDDETVVQGSDPEPVSEDVTLGSSIATGFEEASSVVEAGPYRAAFIAEHSEPFWIPRDDNETQGDSLSLQLAEIPQSANRHLEIVLYDRETNRSIPHADIQLNVADGNEIETRTDLPFLMAAFYHYGNSLYLPKSDYTVEATLGTPNLHTLEEGQFPDEEQATFSWSPANGEEEGEEHEEDH